MEEDQYFPLPRELRDAVRHLAAAAAVAGLAPGGDPTAGQTPPVDDRDLSARSRWPASPAETGGYGPLVGLMRSPTGSHPHWGSA